MTEIMTASSTLVYQRAGPRLKEERQAQDGSRGKSGPRGDQHYVPRNIPSPYAPYRRFHRLEGHDSYSKAFDRLLRDLKAGAQDGTTA